MADAVAAPAAAPSSTPSAPASTPDTSSVPDSGASPSAGASPAAGGGATPAVKAPEVKAEPRRLKVKVDGEEQEVDEMELVRSYQTRAAAARRMEEVAKQRKAFEEQLAAHKKALEDPRVVQAAQEWGVSPEEAQAILKVREIQQREQMSPEAKALMDERKRREEAERKAREFEESRTQEQQQRAIQVETEKLNREVTEAAREIGLPAVPEVGRLMLSHMQSMAKAGLPFDAKESARYAMDMAQGISKSFISKMPDEQLESFLGKGVIDRILARSVQRARGQVGAMAAAAPPPAPAGDTGQRKPLSIEEWRKQMGQ